MPAKDAGGRNKIDKPMSKAETLARYTISPLVLFWQLPEDANQIQGDLLTLINVIKKILSWWDGSWVDTLDKQGSTTFHP